MAKKPKTPKELFEHGPFDRIVSGALRNCIHNHGDITKHNISSATKRIANSVRGYLRSFNAKELQAELLEEAIRKLQEQKDQNDKIIPRLRKSRDDLLKKCRDAGLIE